MSGRREIIEYNISFMKITESILLTATTSWPTPSERANIACSLVCPPASKPASNSPGRESITRIATSA